MFSAFGFFIWGFQRRDEDANFYDFRYHEFAMLMDMNVLCSTDCEVRCNEIDASIVLTKGENSILNVALPVGLECNKKDNVVDCEGHI